MFFSDVLCLENYFSVLAVLSLKMFSFCFVVITPQLLRVIINPLKTIVVEVILVRGFHLDAFGVSFLSKSKYSDPSPLMSST